LLDDRGYAAFEFIDASTESLDARRLNAPLRVFLSLNDDCNYVCKHCSVSATRLGPSLTRERALLLAHELADLGVMEVALVGGEPMMYPHFYDFVEVAASRGLLVNVTTNGSFVDPAACDRLRTVAAGLRYIHVSLEGPENITDFIRGPGAFARSISALQQVAAIGIEATAQITMTSLLRGEEKRLIDSLASAGIRNMCLAPVRATGRATQRPALYLTQADEQACRAELRLHARAAGIRLYAMDDLEALPTLWDHVGAGACGAGAFVLSIGADGGVVPCTFMKGFYAQGGLAPVSLYGSSLAEIWHSSTLFTRARAGDTPRGNSGAKECPAIVRPDAGASDGPLLQLRRRAHSLKA
jgi:MoaA/NifB/PqqE/SkfB family radical SAM enzyme